MRATKARRGAAMHAVPSTAPAACDNCATRLQGSYCHVCGQHAVNPLRHFAHAVEDVFESFWHLDGRVFRTLRDLFVPGRVACNYLAGQRVRYIAPLRLFVILTLLTFFVGQLAAGAGTGPQNASAREGAADGGPLRIEADASEGSDAIRAARTEAQVRAVLAAQLRELAEARTATAAMPWVGVGIDRAEREVRMQADRRIAELRVLQGAAPARVGARHGVAGDAARLTPAPPIPAARAGAVKGAAPAAATGAAATASAPRDASDATAQTRKVLQEVAGTLGQRRDAKADWHERDNPVDIAWLPAFADTWLNHRLGNIEGTTARVAREGQSAILQLMLAAVPPALFVLVPVFALLLRALYPLTRRGYLEHLVVALYSHAFMLVVLLATFVLILLRAARPPDAVVGAAQLLQTLAWLAVPVYLFVMQRRVYGQHWLATLGKYLALGFAYLVLVLAVVVYSVLAGISSGA
jgi:hypothetical protein